MNPATNLPSLKTALKKRVALDLEKTLEELLALLPDSSARKNELIQLEAAFYQIESETRKGIIDYDFRLLQLNRIRASLLDLIDDLKPADLSPDTPVSAPELQIPKSMALTDFDLFIAENQTILQSFPRVYRSARSIIVRHDRNNPEIQTVFQAIQSHLPLLKQYEGLLSPIRGKIHQIRLKNENRPYWIRYQQLQAVAAELEIETLKNLENVLTDLEVLHQELLDKSLITS